MFFRHLKSQTKQLMDEKVIENSFSIHRGVFTTPKQRKKQRGQQNVKLFSFKTFLMCFHQLK